MSTGRREPGHAAPDQRSTRRPAATGERCEMCSAPVADEHQHVVDVQSRSADVHLPALLPAVHRPAGRRCATARSPTATCPSPASGSTRRTGTTCRSPSGWRSCSATARRSGSSRSTRARPARPSPSSPLDAWERVVAANPGARHRAARRRGAAGPRGEPGDGRGVHCHVVPIDACYELVGRMRATWRGFDGGQEARAALDEFFDEVERAQPAGGGAAREPAGVPVLDVAPTPYAAAPELTARLRVEETSGQRVHAVALRVPGPHRAAAPRLRRRRRGGAADAVRRPGPLAADPQAVPVDAVPRPRSRGSPGAPRSTCALPCTYDFDVAGSRYLHALGDGAVPLSLMFSGTVFTRGDHGFGVQQVPWDCEARYDLPVRVWQRPDGRCSSRAAAGSGSTTTRSPRSATTAPGTA